MRNAASTLPVLQANEYVVNKIGFGPGTEFASPPDTVTAEPNYVEITNSAHTDYINVSGRWARIAEVWNRVGAFSPGVAAALDAHHAILLSGALVDPELARIADDLRHSLAVSDSAYAPERDPLPALERVAGISSPDEPSLPPPDELRVVSL